MRKQESEIKPLDREELLQRLEALAEHSPEAVAVFAARCALRVLPFTIGQSVLSGDRHATYAIRAFVLSICGLEYRSIQGQMVFATVGAVNTADIAIYAAANASTDAVKGNVTRAATEAANAYISAASIIVEIGISVTVDLNQLEQGDVESVKYIPLWLGSLPSHISEIIAAWSEAMIALQLGELVQVYEDLLSGKHYPGDKIVSLINDWYQQYGRQGWALS